MYKGIDCAAPLTEEKAREFKALGYDFAGRYFCPPGNFKRLNKSEAEAISAAGLKLLCVWETTADRAKGGMAAGAVDGVRAYNQALELGMPNTGIIYFAVDFDAQSGDFDAIEAYLRAARMQTEEFEIGVYGSYSVVEAMHARGVCKGFWQCVAWSGGKVSAHHTVYQAHWSQTIIGHQVDTNTCPDMDAAGLWNYEEESEMKVYKTINDVPEWYRAAVRKAMDAGALVGTGNGEINVSEDLCRTLTILDRLGKL